MHCRQRPCRDLLKVSDGPLWWYVAADADAVSDTLMRLAAALAALQHRAIAEEHPTLGISNDVHAAVALARLGLGVDARGIPLGQALAQRPGALDLPLMGKSQFPGLKFTVRNT